MFDLTDLAWQDQLFADPVPRSEQLDFQASDTGVAMLEIDEANDPPPRD